jgi:hypothetical protein
MARNLFGIFDDDFSRLSFFDIYVFLGLTQIANGDGRGDARPEVLKSKIFAFRPRITAKDIQSSLVKLSEQERVVLYEEDSITHFYLTDWSQELAERKREQNRLRKKRQREREKCHAMSRVTPLPPSSSLLPPTPPIITPISPNTDDDDKNKLSHGKNAPTREEIEEFWEKKGIEWLSEVEFYAHCEDYGWDNITNWKAYALAMERSEERLYRELLDEQIPRMKGK